jgi:hypothetical protein
MKTEGRRIRMIRHLICISIACTALVSPARGQLYLMTGSPTPKYNEAFGSALLQVGEDGNILPAGDLVSPEVGTGWIAVSHEWRKALIWESSNRVVVIDFDKAAAVKKCQPPLGAGGSLIEQWLVDVPGRGPTFAVYLAGDQAGQTRVQGMIMDVSVPCNESFVALAPTDIRYMVAHGTSGVEDIGSDEGTYVAIDENGRVSKRVMDTTVLFDYEIPAVLRKGMDTTFSRIVINTSQVSVLESGGKTGKPRFWAFRKRDKTWHQIPVRSENLCLQSFGRFVAVVESRAKGDQIEEPALQSSAPAKTSYIQESAGRAEWKKTRSPMGPSMLSRVDDKRAVYPGRLHLYDVNNERVYTIVTNQGDSEILLVEHDVVYYRVSERLYSAPITEKSIGAARLLATAEAIRDAHWAFIKQ